MANVYRVKCDLIHKMVLAPTAVVAMAKFNKYTQRKYEGAVDVSSRIMAITLVERIAEDVLR